MWGMPVRNADALIDMQKNWMAVAKRFTNNAMGHFETKGPEMAREINNAWAKSYQMALGALINMPRIGYVSRPVAQKLHAV